MADKKISQLTAASTPLAGTEVLPIVQSGATKKVTALELTGTTLDAFGNVTIPNGNLVQGTAAKGINFTANTPAAGMTSQLLNWYEGGTWTPTFSFTTAGGVSVSYTAQVGKYTRVGRLVTVSFYVAGTITKNSAAGDLIVQGLPFANASNTSDIYSGVCSMSRGFTTVPTAFLQYGISSSVYVSTGTATIDAAAVTSGNAYSVCGTYTFEV